MSWEKIPLLGGIVALILAAIIISIIWIMPSFPALYFDFILLVVFGIADYFLVRYQDSPYWKLCCKFFIVLGGIVLVLLWKYKDTVGPVFSEWLPV